MKLPVKFVEIRSVNKSESLNDQVVIVAVWQSLAPQCCGFESYVCQIKEDIF